MPQHDAAFDFDGDGVSNGNEWLALTDPADAASTMRVTQLVRTGNNLDVTYPTVLGRNYTLETSPDLATWTPTGTTIPGTGGSVTTTIGPVNGYTKLSVRVRVGL